MTILQELHSHSQHLDNGQSYVNEPPETPAPLFAVRAFKSALFGTPRIYQDFDSATPLPKTPDHKAGKKHHDTRIGNAKNDKLGQRLAEEHVYKPRVASIMSPAKGILVTPGTATTRRKNVSFGGLALDKKGNDKIEKKESNDGDSSLDSDTSNPLVTDPLAWNQYRQTTLTKALYKAKTGSSQDHWEDHTDREITEDEFLPVKSNDDSNANIGSRENLTDLVTDTTIDLDQPFSRSGKHWKAEFERYHKKSDREMKKIIKHGQNVRSYAARKDSEASDLGEKLRLELSKVAAMEAKVSKLAAQLAGTRAHGSNDSVQAEMVNDLAKQTALAVRYKQKADRYRAALSKKTAAATSAEDGVKATLPQSVGLSAFQEGNSKQAPEMVSLQMELEKYRESTKLAEEKANKLEAENLELRKTLARVKEEASTCETERRAREAKLKRNEASLKDTKEDCNTRLNQITSKHQKLLQEMHLEKDGPGKTENPVMKLSENRKRLTKPNLANSVGASNATLAGEILETFGPVHEIKSQDSHVDIWTLSVQENQRTKKPARNEISSPTNAKVSSVLREITQNLTPDRKSGTPLPPSHALPSTDSNTPSRHPGTYAPPDDKPHLHELGSEKHSIFLAPQPINSSAAKRMRERRSTIISPRPSMFNIAPSPPKPVSNPNLADSKPHTTHATSKPAHTHPTSQVSAAPSRPSTLAGVRKQPALPPDRIAAARARLREKNLEKQLLSGDRRETREWRRVRPDGKGGLTSVGEPGENEKGEELLGAL